MDDDLADVEPSPRDVREPPEPPHLLTVRAQILATEHWSLLGSRASTQSEVLTRISMFLTLVSAALVGIALVGQATGFADQFTLFTTTVLAVVAVVGVLTQLRVVNAGMDDLMYVVAMNRLRGAYTELDPKVARVFMASPNDDLAGVQRTYYFLGRSRGGSQVAGSSMVFIVAVNAAVVGLLLAAIASGFGGSTALVATVGVGCALAYFGISLWHGGRRFNAFWRSYSPLFPTED